MTASQQGTDRWHISVVIPVYNSQDTLKPLAEQLLTELRALSNKYEIIFIDDASTDNSWTVLRELRAQYGDSIRIVRLSVNSGQHSALLCGFTFVSGDVVITMDDDLQNPPHEIGKLLKALTCGYDLAIGAYRHKQHHMARNVAGALIDALQRRIFGLPSDFQLTSFRAIRRPIVTEVCKMNAAFPYVTSMLLLNTARCTNVEVAHCPRAVGRSNYNLARSLRLAMNLIFWYSSLPLQIVAVFCGLSLLVSLMLGCWAVARAIFLGSPVPGWASTLAAIAFSSSVSQLSFLIIAVYVSRLQRLLTQTRASFTIGEIDV